MPRPPENGTPAEAGQRPASKRSARRGRKRSSDRKKDPELVRLGDRVRALREGAAMTQEQLAEGAGLHWTYVGQVERGERNPTYKSLLRLATGLRCDPARLVQD